MSNNHSSNPPSYISNIVDLLKRIGINNITSMEFDTIISILYDEMSDRNLAESLSYATGEDYAMCLNRVYTVVSKNGISLKEKARMQIILKNNGYEDDIW